jgi:hypothetical protein
MAVTKENKTFSNLLILQKGREALQLQLKEKYEETITLFADIIIQIMNANNCNEFEAIIKIKENLPFYNEPGSELMFSSALLEIVEGKYFDGFKK